MHLFLFDFCIVLFKCFLWKFYYKLTKGQLPAYFDIILPILPNICNNKLIFIVKICNVYSQFVILSFSHFKNGLLCLSTVGDIILASLQENYIPTMKY